MDFREILYLNIFRKSVARTEFRENRTRIMGTLHEYKYAFLIIFRSVILRIRQTKFVEKIKTHILCFFYLENRAVYEILCKTIAEPGSSQITVLHAG